MKITKFIKIISLCLLVCALFTTVAFADGTATADLTNAKNGDGVIDFEGATLGTIGTSTGLYKYTENANTVPSIVEDADQGKVFKYYKTKAAAVSSYFTIGSACTSVVNTSTISFKLKINTLTNNVLRLYPASSGNDTYMARFALGTSGTQITIDGNIIEGDGIAVGEWMDVQMIYYEGDDDAYTNRKLSLFINGVLAKEITSSFNRNYKAETVTIFGIGALETTVSNVYFDDISVSYAQVSTPEIISANISYESEIYLYYAVPKSSITTGETPKLIGEDVNGSFEVTSYSEATVNGVDCYVFKTRGVPAKEIATEETVRIVAGDAISEPKTYSVQQYLYEKLYDEGYALESLEDSADLGVNDGKDNTRGKLYFKLLEYGALAQELLVESPAKVIGETPYVSINGTTADVSGEVAVGTTYTLEAATAEGKTIASYVVVTSDAFGYSVESAPAAIGDTVTVNAFILVYPVYAE